MCEASKVCKRGFDCQVLLGTLRWMAVFRPGHPHSWTEAGCSLPMVNSRLLASLKAKQKFGAVAGDGVYFVQSGCRN